MAQTWGGDRRGQSPEAHHSFMVSKRWAFCLKFERCHHKLVNDTMPNMMEGYLVVRRLWRAGMKGRAQWEAQPSWVLW